MLRARLRSAALITVDYAQTWSRQLRHQMTALAAAI
jgi:hypothetical protein